MFIIFIVFTMSAISFKFQWKNSVTETETIMTFKSEKIYFVKIIHQILAYPIKTLCFFFQ